VKIRGLLSILSGCGEFNSGGSAVVRSGENPGDLARTRTP